METVITLNTLRRILYLEKRYIVLEFSIIYLSGVYYTCATYIFTCNQYTGYIQFTDYMAFLTIICQDDNSKTYGSYLINCQTTISGVKTFSPKEMNLLWSNKWIFTKNSQLASQFREGFQRHVVFRTTWEAWLSPLYVLGYYFLRSLVRLSSCCMLASLSVSDVGKGSSRYLLRFSDRDDHLVMMCIGLSSPHYIV